METPPAPTGHLPCKAEEFCLRTDKLFAAIDIKSVATYQRGRMKPFFPTEFRLRLYFGLIRSFGQLIHAFRATCPVYIPGKTVMAL